MECSDKCVLLGLRWIKPLIMGGLECLIQTATQRSPNCNLHCSDPLEYVTAVAASTDRGGDNHKSVTDRPHLSVHAFDLIVPSGQLSLPVALLAESLPLPKHPPNQPLPDHHLTLHTHTHIEPIKNTKQPLYNLEIYSK